MLGDFRIKTRSKANWILWWRVDDENLQDQITHYDTLGWFTSARKLSVVCLLFSATMTTLFILAGTLGMEAVADIVIMAVLAAFIYRGHRWAMVAAMVFWTLEKFLTTLGPLGAGKPPNVVGLPISLLWWAGYMHAFFLAFRVERERRKLAASGLTNHDLTVWD